MPYTLKDQLIAIAQIFGLSFIFGFVSTCFLIIMAAIIGEEIPVEDVVETTDIEPS